MSSRSVSRSAPIVILGAGIIGLTTAVRLLESQLIQSRNIPIHVIADHLPNDPLDARYASTVAGAHHLSFADDGDARQIRADKRSEYLFIRYLGGGIPIRKDGEEEIRIRGTMTDKIAFEVMSEEWRNEGEKTGLMRLKQTEFYVGTKDHLKIFESHPDVGFPHTY